MKKILVTLLAAFTLVSAPSAALAYGGTTPTVDGTAAVGQTVTATWPAGTFIDGEALTAECDSGCEVVSTPPPAVFRAAPVAGFIAAENGSFSIQVKILALPAQVTVTGAESEAVAIARFAAPATPAAAGLSSTGSSTTGFLWVGGAVLALGAGISVMVASRRKHGVHN